MRNSRVCLDAGRGGTISANPVRRMTARMHNRGPDAEGVWASEGVVLGYRRLVILDLDARANQPMVSTDGRYTIVFNGEIYNFREVRLVQHSPKFMISAMYNLVANLYNFTEPELQSSSNHVDWAARL